MKKSPNYGSDFQNFEKKNAENGYLLSGKIPKHGFLFWEKITSEYGYRSRAASSTSPSPPPSPTNPNLSYPPSEWSSVYVQYITCFINWSIIEMIPHLLCDSNQNERFNGDTNPRSFSKRNLDNCYIMGSFTLWSRSVMTWNLFNYYFVTNFGMADLFVLICLFCLLDE